MAEHYDPDIQAQKDYEALNASTALELNKAQQRIAELEAIYAALKIEGDHPFPGDFTALDLAVERNKEYLKEIERLRAVLRRLTNEAKGTIGMYGFCSLVGVTNMTILQIRIDEALAALEQDDE